MAVRVLVVDDEPSIVELVSYNLKRAGFEVVSASNGEDALSLVHGSDFDLLVLDLMLPGMDGFGVCRELRKTSETPVLMLTARGDEIDRVVGFEIGVDDYVTKPFSPRELVGRVKAILRRTHLGTQPHPDIDARTFGHLSINYLTYEVTSAGQAVALTPTEFQLLKVLSQHPGRVFSRDELANQAIGTDFYGDVRTVDVHIRHLREKIEEIPAAPLLIQTVRGAGYKFVWTPAATL